MVREREIGRRTRTTRVTKDTPGSRPTPDSAPSRVSSASFMAAYQHEVATLEADVADLNARGRDMGQRALEYTFKQTQLQRLLAVKHELSYEPTENGCKVSCQLVGGPAISVEVNSQTMDGPADLFVNGRKVTADSLYKGRSSVLRRMPQKGQLSVLNNLVTLKELAIRHGFSA